MGTIRAQAGRYGLAVNHSTYHNRQVGVSPKEEPKYRQRKKFLYLFFLYFGFLTLFPSESNDVRRTLAHHLGDVQGAVGLIGYGDGAVNCLSLHLWMMTGAHRGPTHTGFVFSVQNKVWILTSSGRLSTWPSGPVIPSSNMRFCS